jgi:hypothetical protein
MRAYDEATLPSRVRRAFRLAEPMVRERYLKDALPLVVAGIEALLKIRRRNLSAQFEQRSAALARKGDERPRPQDQATSARLSRWRSGIDARYSSPAGRRSSAVIL